MKALQNLVSDFWIIYGEDTFLRSENNTIGKKYDFILLHIQLSGRGLSDIKNFDNFFQLSLK